MTLPAKYLKANTTAQWFGDKWSGDKMDSNFIVLHSTETTAWPGYSGGADAPQLTWWPGKGFRQHFDLTRSARALENWPGGVETNTANAIQIEIIGTCDPAFKKKYPNAIYVPDLTDEQLMELAEFVAWLEKNQPKFNYKQTPAKWLPYPSSYGNANGQRMTAKEWDAFYGICGHQHAPENHHGDPGNFPIKRLQSLVEGLLGGPVSNPTPKPSEPVKTQPEPSEVVSATKDPRPGQWYVNAAELNGREKPALNARVKWTRKRGADLDVVEVKKAGGRWWLSTGKGGAWYAAAYCTQTKPGAKAKATAQTATTAPAKVVENVPVTSKYVRPVQDVKKNPISAAWRIPGDWQVGHHTGVDIACNVGTPVYATIGGDVRTQSRRNAGRAWGAAYGTMVIINDNEDGSDWGYCHLSKVVVKEGERVKTGQLVGYSGNTGNTTGPHLHLERRPRAGGYGSDRNPNLWP